MKPTIFLDMDGVCCNFIKSALTVWERMDLYENAVWLPDMLEIDEPTFWARIRPHEPSFWREIEPFPWFDELYQELSKRGKVVFCTSPARSANSLLGKMQWLQDRFGEAFRDFIITPKKFYCGHYPNSILIDDLERNTDEWDGHCILFPQQWNSTKRKPDPNSIVSEIVSRIDTWLKTL